MIDSINFDGLIALIFRISNAISIGIAVGWFKNCIVKLDRHYREPFYILSHYWHNNKHEFRSIRKRLDEDLEYSLQISTPDDETPSQIIIKNIGESNIEELCLSVIAEKCFEGFNSYFFEVSLDTITNKNYPKVVTENSFISVDESYSDDFYDRQNYIKILNLSPQKVVRYYLNNIPPHEIYYIAGTSRVHSSYKNIYVHLLSKQKDGILYKTNFISGKGIISFDNRLNDHINWKRKWGKNYNISLLNQSMQRFELSIYGSIESWSWKDRGVIPVWFKRKKLRPIYILMLRTKFIGLVFWFFLLSHRIILTPNFPYYKLSKSSGSLIKWLLDRK
ncbi:MAG: hypothetical protein HC852_13690 [Acaryochloridaceae cyanobacterium RU_4_10]|nr:hypothetical protein [Acaryochloridaceae cyanobacterium RU_4_10]